MLASPEMRAVWKEGWLTKASDPKSAFKNWQRRWFVLDNVSLSYYKKDAKSMDLKGQVAVENIHCSKPGSVKGTFSIHTKDRIYDIRADDPETANAWVQTLNTVSLHWLVRNGGSRAQVGELLELGASPNTVVDTAEKQTLLSLAVMVQTPLSLSYATDFLRFKGDAKVLLRSRFIEHLSSFQDVFNFFMSNLDVIDINTQSEENGYTLLHFACSDGFEKFTSQLLSVPSIDVNRMSIPNPLTNGTGGGLSAFHLLLVSHRVYNASVRLAIAKSLVAKGLHLDVIDPDGDTYLTASLKRRITDVALMLIGRAQITKSPNNGSSEMLSATTTASSSTTTASATTTAASSSSSSSSKSRYSHHEPHNDRDSGDGDRDGDFDGGGFSGGGFSGVPDEGSISVGGGMNSASDRSLLNTKDRDGNSPLHLCAILQFKDVAAALVHGGCDVNAVDRSGEGCISKVIPLNWDDLMYTMLNLSTADVNARRSVDGQSILSLLITHRKPDIVRHMLSASSACHANPNLRNHRGENSLQVAVRTVLESVAPNTTTTIHHHQHQHQHQPQPQQQSQHSSSPTSILTAEGGNGSGLIPIQSSSGGSASRRATVSAVMMSSSATSADDSIIGPSGAAGGSGSPSPLSSSSLPKSTRSKATATTMVTRMYPPLSGPIPNWNENPIERKVLNEILPSLFAANIHLDTKTVEDEVSRHETVLHAMARGNLVPEVEALLAYADQKQQRHRILDSVDIGGYSPLQIAVYFGHFEMVALLLEKGAPVNHQNNVNETALHVAVKNSPIISTSAAAIARPSSTTTTTSTSNSDPSGQSPASGNAQRIIAELLRHHADYTLWDSAGKAAIHYATEIGCLETLRVFESCDGIFNLRSSLGYTPILLATELNLSPVVGFLAAQGAFLNLQLPESRDSALHIAARNNSVSIAAILLKQNGILANLRNVDGNTPLLIASSTTHHHPADHRGADGGDPNNAATAAPAASVESLLIAAGADPNARNRIGQSCVDIRRELQPPVITVSGSRSPPTILPQVAKSSTSGGGGEEAFDRSGDVTASASTNPLNRGPESRDPVVVVVVDDGESSGQINAVNVNSVGSSVSEVDGGAGDGILAFDHNDNDDENDNHKENEKEEDKEKENDNDNIDE